MISKELDKDAYIENEIDEFLVMEEKKYMKKRKKLLVTASTFPRWKEDTEPRFVLDLCLHLTEEFDVTVLVPAAYGAKEDEIIDGINIIRYHYFPIHRWETLCYPGAIMSRIKEKQIRVLLVPFLFVSLFFHLLKMLPEYDIVHAHWLIPQGIVQSFFKKPYIVTGHGGDVTSLNKGLFKKLKTKCLRNAKAVTVVSNHLSEKVKELTPELHISIIPMGVNTTLFGRQYYRPDYFGQEDKKVILFVGRLAEKKGVSYLIDAMKYIDAVLVIVGDGPMRRKLESQAADMKNKVRFFGARTHEELKIIYASADVFVAPSVTAEDGDQEGLGLVILEAMCSGLAVVASDSGGIKDVVHDGYNGLLAEEKNSADLANKIKILLKDEAFYKRIVCNSAESVQQYDYNVLAKKYCGLLNKY